MCCPTKEIPFEIVYAEIYVFRLRRAMAERESAAAIRPG